MTNGLGVDYFLTMLLDCRYRHYIHRTLYVVLDHVSFLNAVTRSEAQHMGKKLEYSPNS